MYLSFIRLYLCFTISLCPFSTSPHIPFPLLPSHLSLFFILPCFSHRPASLPFFPYPFLSYLPIPPFFSSPPSFPLLHSFRFPHTLTSPFHPPPLFPFLTSSLPLFPYSSPFSLSPFSSPLFTSSTFPSYLPIPPFFPSSLPPAPSPQERIQPASDPSQWTPKLSMLISRENRS